MRRDDPIDEPWYELTFRMSRWRCPKGLPASMMEDVVEVIRDMDRILLRTMQVVDQHSYGTESSTERYTRESLYEHLRVAFESLEDDFMIAQHHLKARWTELEKQYRKEIASLSLETIEQLRNPEKAYSIEYFVSEIELDDHLKQFLEGIKPGT